MSYEWSHLENYEIDAIGFFPRAVTLKLSGGEKKPSMFF